MNMLILTPYAYAALRDAANDYAPGDPCREAVEALPGRRLQIDGVHPEDRLLLSQVAQLYASEIHIYSKARGRLGRARDSLCAWELRRFSAKLRRSLAAAP